MGILKPLDLVLDILEPLRGPLVALGGLHGVGPELCLQVSDPIAIGLNGIINELHADHRVVVFPGGRNIGASGVGDRITQEYKFLLEGSQVLLLGSDEELSLTK